MVFKVSKGGVRSGNTLRGLQSRRTKQYSRHACLLGLSSLNRQDLDNFINTIAVENELVGDTLKRNNVLLSLNKKQRWQVPAALNQLISYGNHNKYPMVSLLERHILKRRANCVRFATTGGRLANVQPKQKKYFSLSLDKIDDETSNREKRRRFAEALKKQKTPTTKLLRRKHTGLVKTVDTFTQDGKQNILSEKGRLVSNKEEYRVEVLYPCPQSCSLTFNPKYTDVVVEEGITGTLEVNSNVKVPKHVKRHHRRRYSTKEIDHFCEEAIEDDVNRLWEDAYGSDTEENLNSAIENEATEHQPYINDFELLISQAEKAQKLLVKEKRKQTKAKKEKRTLEGKKRHIVFMDAEKNQTLEKNTEAINPPQYLQEIKPLDFVKVILNSTETNKESLSQQYGAMYTEANCHPRRFMINITEDVSNLLSSTKSSSNNHMFVSYLVFIHDGVYDDGQDVFQLIFNSYLCSGKHNLSESMKPFSLSTIDDIMNTIVGHLLDLKERKEIDSLDLQHSINCKGVYSFLYNRLNVKVKTFDPSTALSEKPPNENERVEKSMKLDDLLDSLSSSFDEDIFCDICYDVLNPTKIDAVCGTQLDNCGHHCCNSCWASHFKSRMRDGITTMTCPGYDCKNTIGLVTLLSIVDVSEVALLFQRKVEEEVEESDNAKWCPNPNCGLVIKLDSSSKDFCQDVVCACGTEICFACFGPAHWPANCDQAEEYLGKLATMKPPKENVEEPDVKPTSQPKPKKAKFYEIEGRVCPRCNRFINKNGGCNYMVCKCGREFCWECMQPHHNSSCEIDHQYLYKHTRLVRVHHIERTGEVFDAPTVDRPKVDNAKQKATLYQRALQQRLEAAKPSENLTSKKSLVLKIVSTANKDLQFKQEIIRKMEHEAVSRDVYELTTLNVKPSVAHLIRSSKEIKSVLHHVAEFSFVLLQDMPNSVEKQRILRLANDVSGICSFFASILDLGNRQDAKIAFRRLVSIQEWAGRVLDALIAATRGLRYQ